jgi:sugar/nucleoside kinase (ribokinase family)
MLHMGGAVVDYIYRVSHLPPRGGESVASTHARMAGGGFNQMVAARRSGLPVAYGGGHGSGPDGDFLRAALRDSGIDVLQPQTADIDSGNCVVMIDDEGERSFVSWAGAEGRLSDSALAAITARAGDWVVVSGYTLSYPDSREALARWLGVRSAAQPLVFDPSPVIAAVPPTIRDAVLARTTWLSANREEARQLTGEDDPARQAAVLLDRLCPAAKGVVLRAGAAGAWLQCRGAPSVHLPPFAVKAVDTNGAGDTHLGVFVATLAQQGDAGAAALRANAAAAISVTRPGGASSPSAAEIDAFLAHHQAPADTAMASDF